MPIYIDVSAAVHRRAGLGRYAESLARALWTLAPERLALFYNREQGVEPLPGLEAAPARTVALGYKPWRTLVALGQAAGLSFARLVPGAQLFHATEHLLLPLRGVPTVLTVHDLIFRHLPQHHKALNRWYLNLTLPLYCRRATHIIAVSAHTRRDLVAAYRVPAEKITVIPEAADAHLRPAAPEAVARTRARYGLPERYVLAVGTLEPRKNLGRLLAAWEPLYLAGEAPPLVVAGKRGWLYDDFLSAVERSPARAGLCLTGYVAEGDLAALYTGAEVFAMPSLFEGFGLPPLEAMACGTPVLCSSASSLPEVVDEAGLLLPPDDTEAWRAGLQRLLRDAGLRAELRTRGLARASLFTWEEAARRTLALYDRLLEVSHAPGA